MSASALHACVGTHAHSPSTHSPSGACHGCFRRRCRACLVRSGLVRPQFQLRAELHSAESNAHRSSCRCSAALSAGCSSAQTPSHRRNSPPTHSSAHRLTRSPRHSCLTRLLTQVAPARPRTGPCLGLRLFAAVGCVWCTRVSARDFALLMDEPQCNAAQCSAVVSPTVCTARRTVAWLPNSLTRDSPICICICVAVCELLRAQSSHASEALVAVVLPRVPALHQVTPKPTHPTLCAHTVSRARTHHCTWARPMVRVSARRC